jgi:hypothetical protein
MQACGAVCYLEYVPKSGQWSVRARCRSFGCALITLTDQSRITTVPFRDVRRRRNILAA